MKISHVLFALCCLITNVVAENSVDNDVKYLKPYEMACQHTVTRISKATFQAKMMMAWLFLADGRFPKELSYVVSEAKKWDDRNGDETQGVGGRGNTYGSNWLPALAGIFLVEYSKHYPEKMPRDTLKAMVKHFEYTQKNRRVV